MGSGIGQRLIFLIFLALFVTMGLIGTTRYFIEKRDIIAEVRLQGEQSGKLMTELAAPYMLRSDLSGLQTMAEHFIHTPIVQEVTIVDREGHELIHVSKPVLEKKRIVIGSQPVLSDAAKLGEVRLAVYPAEPEGRIGAAILGTLYEHLLIFMFLAAILSFSVYRTITKPARKLSSALKEVLDRKDFTLRVGVQGCDEIEELANSVNVLIARLEQFIIAMSAISTRINELSPTIASDAQEIKKNAEIESVATTSVSSSVSEMSSSIQSISESAESLSVFGRRNVIGHSRNERLQPRSRPPHRPSSPRRSRT